MTLDRRFVKQSSAAEVMYFLITAVPPSDLGVDFISQVAYERAALRMAERMAQEGVCFTSTDGAPDTP